MKRLGAILLIACMPVVLSQTGCEDKGCEDCGGGLLEGYVFKRVTQEDLATLQGHDIEGLEFDACIRVKIVGEEMDPETVSVVDDCCCDKY